MKLRVREREVGYDDSGSGPAVIWLHAFPLDRRMWAGTVAALAASGRRLITVDARGFGQSAPGGGCSIAQLADDLAGLMDALDIPAATVGGLSMGGYVALAFARLHPRRLSRLILAATRAAADTPQALQARQQALALIAREGAAIYLDQSLPRLLAPAAAPSTLTEVRALAETRAPSLVAGIEALRDRPDRTAELGAIRVPTLVISGALDQVVSPGEMRLMSQAIPGSRFVSLEGAGHLVNIESPAPFTQAVLEFLGSQERP